VIETHIPEVVKDVEPKVPVVEVEVEVEVEQTSPEPVPAQIEEEELPPVETPHNPPRIEASRKTTQKALLQSPDAPSNNVQVEVPVVKSEESGERRE
jgi:hypothetical protein